MSHRSVELHTYAPIEHDSYTFTPTKIGGHSLDHVRNGFLVGERATRNVRLMGFCEGRFGGLVPLPLKLKPAKRSSGIDSRGRVAPYATIFPMYTSPVDVPPASCSYQPLLTRLRGRCALPKGSWMWPRTNDHSSALVAALLSKLVNGTGREGMCCGEYISTGGNSVSDGTPTPEDLLAGRGLEAIRIGTAGSRDCQHVGTDGEDHMAHKDLDNSDMWEWNARLGQVPHHSKLRRYSFMLKLGQGAHGTVFLVRKRIEGVGNKRRVGKTERSQGEFELRVLKESEALHEAVNEARLLLLSTQQAIEDPSIGNSPCNEGKMRGGTSSKGICSNCRGEVIQMHDFFVETLGHRTVAFMELDYCEGGDLSNFILSGGEHLVSPIGDGAGTKKETQPSVEPKKAMRGRGAGSGGAGTGMRNIVPRGLKANKIAAVVLGLCEALLQLHMRGIVHRDLKPANILFTAAGAVRVADLGVSTDLGDRQITENPAGSIPFMAPEVRRYLLGDKVAYSSKADVWAIGALLYAMAVGDAAPAELVTASRGEMVSAVGHQTGCERLALVAHKTLQLDPNMRPNVQEVAKMLQDYGDNTDYVMEQTNSSRHIDSLENLHPVPASSKL